MLMICLLACQIIIVIAEKSVYYIIIKMVYKVRNKGFNNFSAAQTVRAYPARKTNIDVYMDQHVTLQVHITRFTGMRILHNYRNISRATKQFMMGDRFLEQLMILQLREHFYRPMYYRAALENTFFMVSHTLSKSDRIFRDATSLT